MLSFSLHYIVLFIILFYSTSVLYSMGFPGSTSGKEPAWQCRRFKETQVRFLGQEYPLEEGMATHSSILAWGTPWAEEPGGLQSSQLQRVGHNWSDLTCMHPCIKGAKKLFIEETSINVVWQLLKVTLETSSMNNNHYTHF